MTARRRRQMGKLLAQLAATVLTSTRRRTELRLKANYGDASPVTAMEVFGALGQDLGDTLSLLGNCQANDILPLSEDAREVLDEALACGRGVVFCTAHLGPIEVMAASVAERGYDVVTLARESYDPRFTEVYNAVRQPRGVKTIYRGREGMERSMIRALRDGKLIGFPMDLAGRGMATETYNFLGQPTEIPIGPARIALRLHAPVVVGTPAWGQKGLHISVEPITTENIVKQDERTVTQAIVKALERRILNLPAHWVWMHL